VIVVIIIMPIPAFISLAFSVSPTKIRYVLRDASLQGKNCVTVNYMSNEDPWCGRVNQSINQLFINSKRTKLPVTSQ